MYKLGAESGGSVALFWAEAAHCRPQPAWRLSRWDSSSIGPDAPIFVPRLPGVAHAYPCVRGRSSSAAWFFVASWPTSGEMWLCRHGGPRRTPGRSRLCARLFDAPPLSPTALLFPPPTPYEHPRWGGVVSFGSPQAVSSARRSRRRWSPGSVLGPDEGARSERCAPQGRSGHGSRAAPTDRRGTLAGSESAWRGCAMMCRA